MYPKPKFYPGFDCGWSSIVNDYFENTDVDGNKIVKNVRIGDFHPSQILALLKSFDSPRRAILENILRYAASLEKPLIRILSEYSDPIEGIIALTPEECGVPWGALTRVRVESKWSWMYLIPHDRRFLAILNRVEDEYLSEWIRLRFPYIDSRSSFTKGRRNWISDSHEISVQKRGSGDDIRPIPYDSERNWKDQKLLSQLLFGEFEDVLSLKGIEQSGLQITES